MDKESADPITVDAEETVHRSPHTFELVEPTKGIDRRSLESNVQKRVQGRQQHSNGGSGQLFENNALKGHPVTHAAETDPDRLFNLEGNPPNFAIVREKPEHRLIVYLKAQGLSNREVAKKTGYSEPWVCQVCRQPWFRLRLVQELKEAGVDAVAEIIKSAALDSVWTLIDIRDDQQAPKAVRKASADSLLDRFLGKPTQRVETEEKKIPSTEAIRALDSEIQEIDKELESKTNGI